MPFARAPRQTKSCCETAIASAAWYAMPMLGARAQLNVDWERRPAPGRKSTDTTLLFGVDYSW